jgi:phosphoribosylamine--glycine ligase
VLMMRLESDLLPILHATATGTLERVSATWRDETALTVVLASKGYPGSFETFTPIRALPENSAESRIFHAGTALRDGQLVATGGRVLNVTGIGADPASAQKAAYAAVDQVAWDNGFCRRDIGWRALTRA